jgi:SAM-dependent methyltransferase
MTSEWGGHAKWTRSPASIEIGDIWEMCLSVEYDQEQLVNGLASWLGPPEKLEILDAACGSGFPALELRRLGYRITCSDGSEMMLERFRRNAATAGLPSDAVRADWDELGELYPRRFDVAFCRGCSLIYAGSWDTDSDPDPAALKASLRGLVQCLRPGGRLYLDVAEEVGAMDPSWDEHVHRIGEGSVLRLRERVVTEPGSGLRCWQVEWEGGGQVHRLERRSHYLPHARLAAICRDAGLVDFRRIEVPGERYAVFTGQRGGEPV